MMYELFEPARLGPLTLRNRTVRSATNEHLSDRDGGFTEAWVDALTELAEGGVGLIVTGHMTVDRAQRADEGQIALDERSDLFYPDRAARAAHRNGAAIVAQLSHSGLKAMASVNGVPPMGPDDFGAEELDELVLRFVRAAELMRKTGFDGVQIHNAHGYLLSSFMDPRTNHRGDAYGGTMQNRFRLTGRIIHGVRQVCGADFAILAKADCNTVEDFPALARLYEEAGVDALEISGIDFNARAGENGAFYLDRAIAAREAVSMPLILTGGIFSRREAEHVLAAGIPFVGFSRALICQSDYINRMQRGEESACLRCNGCYGVYRKRPVRCVQHDGEIPQLRKIYLNGDRKG